MVGILLGDEGIRATVGQGTEQGERVQAPAADVGGMGDVKREKDKSRLGLGHGLGLGLGLGLDRALVPVLSCQSLVVGLIQFPQKGQ